MPAKKKKTVQKTQTSKKDVDEGKGMAILSYALITSIIVLLTEKKNQFARFHAKQALAAGMLMLILNAATSWMWWLLWLPIIINLAFVIILSYLAVMAAQGKKTEFPVITAFGSWLVDVFKL